MGVHRNTVSNLINGGVLTAPVAIKLAAALGNTPEFGLTFNMQLIFGIREIVIKKKQSL